MTLDEARKVAKIIGNADTYCRTCTESLVGEATREFPTFVWSLTPGFDLGPDEWVTVRERAPA